MFSCLSIGNKIWTVGFLIKLPVTGVYNKKLVFHTLSYLILFFANFPDQRNNGTMETCFHDIMPLLLSVSLSVVMESLHSHAYTGQRPLTLQRFIL